jgi:hypothetical protein
MTQSPPLPHPPQCKLVVTYTAGYFLTEAYSDYPFFMGFLDINEPSFLPENTPTNAAGDLVEWVFPNNETLISVTPESQTTIESNLDKNNNDTSSSSSSSISTVRVRSNVDHFKFIGHRHNSGNHLDSPKTITLNGDVCEEIVYSDIVQDPDSTVRASAQSRELTEGMFDTNDEPGVLLFYRPDEKSLMDGYPKSNTKFDVSVVNVGFKPLSISSLSIKYYFKNPGLNIFLSTDTWEVTFSDCMEIFGSFHNPTPIDCEKLGLLGNVRAMQGEKVEGADYVLEITFADRDLWLSPIQDLGNSTGIYTEGSGEMKEIAAPTADDDENGNGNSSSSSNLGSNLANPIGIYLQPKIHLDFYTQTQGYFLIMNETKDFSFRPPAEDGSWITNQNITVDVSNRTIWGTDLEHAQDSQRFNIIGSNAGMPGGAHCNGGVPGGNGNSSSGGVGCMVIKRYCCQRGIAEDFHPATRHDTTGSQSRAWIYVLVGVGMVLAALSALLLIYVVRRRRAEGGGGDEREIKDGQGEILGGSGSTLVHTNQSQHGIIPLSGLDEGGRSSKHYLNPVFSLFSRKRQKKKNNNSRHHKMSVSLRELNTSESLQHLNGSASLRDLYGGSSAAMNGISSHITPSPDYSPTSALHSVFKNPFAVLPASPKLALPDLFTNSDGELFEVIDPSHVRPLRFIGSGAFGSVYEAILEKHGRVAVKLVNIRNMTDSSSGTKLESFKREVNVLARVNHTNVVKLHGACLCPPNVFIVMELMKGSLRDKLDRVGRLDYENVLKLANEISSALAYLHPSIVHRDLKPQNILIDSNGAAKVADFGIAKFKQSTYLQTTRGNGTPAYMAPESFGSDKISEKADVFSLGMILWECWTGDTPWKEVEIPFQVVMLVGVEKKRPEIPPDCPKALSSLIQRCWDDDPHRRPSCAEVERKTRLLLHHLDSYSSSSTDVDAGSSSVTTITEVTAENSEKE